VKHRYLKIIIIGALMSMACTTKVSECILLNEMPDHYMLVYFHKDEITGSVRKQNNDLANRLVPANIVFRSIAKDEIDKPYYALYFRNRLISEYADYAALDNITSSPLRNEVASALMDGKLCVLLYLRSGKQEKDEKGMQTVNRTVAASPFGKVITVLDLDRNSAEESQFVSMLLNVESDLKDIHEPLLFGFLDASGHSNHWWQMESLKKTST